jgi:hypothetical protein
MSKLSIFLASVALLAAQQSFAHSSDPFAASSPDCESISKICLSAGYTREGSQGKEFWHDCMKPVLFGKTVAGVNVDNKVVRACRAFKINNLKNQIEELKKLQS